MHPNAEPLGSSDVLLFSDGAMQRIDFESPAELADNETAYASSRRTTSALNTREVLGRECISSSGGIRDVFRTRLRVDAHRSKTLAPRFTETGKASYKD